MQLKPASLSARITSLLVIISLLVMGGGARWMDWRVDHEMNSRFQQNLLTQASALSTLLQLERDAPPAITMPASQMGMLGGDHRIYYEVRCAGAPTRRSTPALPAAPNGWPQDAGAQPHFAKLRHAGQHLGTVQFTFPAMPERSRDQPAAQHDDPGAGNTCALLFAQDRQVIDQILLAIDWILLLGPLLALLLALVAVPLIVRHGMRPMAVLVERMRDIGPNAPGQRLSASGVRELDPLVARFNDVLTRMDDGLARERQFASGLAHETRTRLAELRALTEVELRYPSGRSLQDILREVGSIGAELEATVTALLLLTRLQAGMEQPLWQSLALEPWLRHQMQRTAALADRRHVGMYLHTAHASELHTDSALLEVLVSNLLGNACAYAPTGSTVNIRLNADALHIDNAAPGLERADLANFGQRFWRKQLPHASHAGLGLALAAAAASVLGLTLRFDLDAAHVLHTTLAWPTLSEHPDARA